MNEADTCRIYVEPKLREAGWETPPRSVASQAVIAPGKIIPHGKLAKRQDAQRPDYLLRYAPHLTLDVVEAKRDTLPAGAGLQQAKAYAEQLGLKFAYSTNGIRIVEFNFITGRERELDSFPTPDELWGWLHPGTDMALQQGLLTPYYRFPAWNRTSGSAQLTVPLRAIRVFPVVAPPLADQHEIVTYLDDLQAKVDAVKRLQTETQAELNALLPSVLDRAFRGES